MSEFQHEISQRTLGLKAGLGTLLELVDNWVLHLGNETILQRHLLEIEQIALRPGSGLSDSDRTAIKNSLTAIIGHDINKSYSSLDFRQRLKKLFLEQTDKLQVEMDGLLKSLGKVFDSEPTVGLILAQEDERKRISREIHDGPAQSLASLTMRVDYCMEKVNEPTVLRTELLDLKDSIIKSLKDIRRFIFDLRPMALDDLGLIPTIEQFLSGFKARTGYAVPLHVDGERFPLDPERELAIFRVIQEAVNNANRHSQAKMIHVFLTFDASGKKLEGVVKDNGVGFDVINTRKKYSTLKKLGLLSMEERIKLAGGKLSIVSGPGEGTLVSFSLVVPEPIQ